MANEAYRDFVEKNSTEDAEAYTRTYNAYKEGLTRYEVATYYDKWAENGNYDRDLNPTRYTGPEEVAKALSLHFCSGRETVKILDVAAGTGRLGQELHRLGFRNIDALDPSRGMLEKAKERNVYKKFINEFVTADRPLPIPDGTYDGVIVAGGMGEGHIPSKGILEMMRLIRKGGVMCIAVRSEYLHHVVEYKTVLLPLIDSLQKTGRLTLYAKENVTNFAFGKDGILFSFIVN